MKNTVRKQDKSNSKNEVSKMNPVIVEKVVDMIKNISDLCKKVIDAGDPEKYAKSIQELNQGMSDTYDEMRKIIVNSEKFSEEEKLERLNKLAEKEIETKKKCDAAVKGNREAVAKITLEVVKGLLTCGLYFVPAIIKNLKTTIIEEDDILEIEAESAGLINEQ